MFTQKRAIIDSLKNIQLIKIINADWFNPSILLKSEPPFLRIYINRMSAAVHSWIMILVIK